MLLVTIVQDAPGAPLDVCAVSAVTHESACATLALPALLDALGLDVCEVLLSVADPGLRAAVERRVTACQVHAEPTHTRSASALCDAYLAKLALPPRHAPERAFHEFMANPPQMVQA